MNINDTSTGFSIVDSENGDPFPIELIITIIAVSSATALGIIATVVIVKKRKLKT